MYVLKRERATLPSQTLTHVHRTGDGTFSNPAILIHILAAMNLLTFDMWWSDVTHIFNTYRFTFKAHEKFINYIPERFMNIIYRGIRMFFLSLVRMYYDSIAFCIWIFLAQTTCIISFRYYTIIDCGPSLCSSSLALSHEEKEILDNEIWKLPNMLMECLYFLHSCRSWWAGCRLPLSMPLLLSSPPPFWQCENVVGDGSCIHCTGATSDDVDG